LPQHRLRSMHHQPPARHRRESSMHCRPTCALIALAVLAATTCSALPAVAQSDFNRNDTYSWPSHLLDIANSNTPGVANALITIKNPVDYRQFRLHILNDARLIGDYKVYAVHVDFDGNGIDDLTVPQFFEATKLWTYPEPSGWTQQQTIRVTVDFMNNTGQGDRRIVYIPITIAATPRTYVSAENDAFVQV